MLTFAALIFILITIPFWLPLLAGLIVLACYVAVFAIFCWALYTWPAYTALIAGTIALANWMLNKLEPQNGY